MSSRMSNEQFQRGPDVSRDTFIVPESRNLSRKNVSASDRNWSTRLEVYDRLFTHHTFSSIRRDSRLAITDMMSSDSLDFLLSSIYVHSEDFDVPKSYVPMQPETLNISKQDAQQYYNISSGFSKTIEDKEKEGKETVPVKKRIVGPRISIATSLPISKKRTKKYETSFPIGKKYRQESGYKGSGRMTPRQRATPHQGMTSHQNTASHRGMTSHQSTASHRGTTSRQGMALHQIVAPRHNKTSPRNKYEKSSANKRIPSPGRKYPKTAVSTRGHDQISSGKKYGMTRHDVKSADTMAARNHKFAGEKADDTFDKTQRRESYAAQMRAIERIHPSSLKLAVDGPHLDQTNPGYSRKIDGTFYGI